MSPIFQPSATRPPLALGLALAFLAMAAHPRPAHADRIQDESLEELLEVQDKVKQLVGQGMAATVAIVGPRGMGSGVVVNEEGLILTAGHVTMRPGQRLEVVFNDGSKARAVALGLHQLSDAGMVKITSPKNKKWAYVEMEKEQGASDIGKWCFALGHPEGRDEERGMVLRVGRILEKNLQKVRSSCELMVGDSGGPLFSLNGKVIGIHSFIGGDFTDNYHVSMRPFQTHWDAMLDRQLLSAAGRGRGGFLGIRSTSHPQGAVIEELVSGPPRKAGLQAGDIITTIDGNPVESHSFLINHLREKAPKEKITITYLRGEKTTEITITLDKRP